MVVMVATLDHRVIAAQEVVVLADQTELVQLVQTQLLPQLVLVVMVMEHQVDLLVQQALLDQQLVE